MDVVELTQELVRINSENPPGNEEAIAKFVKDFLEDAGIQAELIKSGEKRFNVVASVGSGEGGLMLNGHLDTVPIGEGWTEKPLGGEVKDGKLYGRGSFDMKGGIAAMMVVARKLAKESLKRRLLFTFVADEEAGSVYGTEYLEKNRKDLFGGIKLGVICEPTGIDKIRIAQKGIYHVRVTFTGKAAHGSRPDLGDNAIMKAVSFINEVEKLRGKLPDKKHDILGSGTISIGKIAGGVKVNVVPDKCVVDIDRRIVPDETFQSAARQFQDMLDRLGLEAKVEPLAARDPMVISESSPIVKEIMAILPNAKLVGLSGYTEAEMYYKDLGIDCVSWGAGLTGDKNLAHMADEYAEVEELKRTAELYEKIARRLCL